MTGLTNEGIKKRVICKKGEVQCKEAVCKQNTPQDVHRNDKSTQLSCGVDIWAHDLTRWLSTYEAQDSSMGALGKWCGYGPTCGSSDSAFACAHVTGCCSVLGLGGKIVSVGTLGDESCLSHTCLVGPMRADCGSLDRFPRYFRQASTCHAGGACKHCWQRRWCVRWRTCVSWHTWCMRRA